MLAATAGCETRTISSGGRDLSSTPTVQPGDALPVGSTETIAVSGFYVIPPGATFLTTRCVGEVSVTIEAVAGSPVTNACSGDGSSSQTTVVAGVGVVFYDVADGAFSLVTVT